MKFGSRPSRPFKPSRVFSKGAAILPDTTQSTCERGKPLMEEEGCSHIGFIFTMTRWWSRITLELMLGDLNKTYINFRKTEYLAANGMTSSGNEDLTVG